MLSLLAKPQPTNEVSYWAHEVLSAIVINRCNTHQSWGGHSIAYTHYHIIEDIAGCVEVAQPSQFRYQYEMYWIFAWSGGRGASRWWALSNVL